MGEVGKEARGHQVLAVSLRKRRPVKVQTTVMEMDLTLCKLSNERRRLPSMHYHPFLGRYQNLRSLSKVHLLLTKKPPWSESGTHICGFRLPQEKRVSLLPFGFFHSRKLT